jgi:zinc protease
LSASNVPAQNVSDPRLHVLENGMRVITLENHNAPLVSAVWTAHVGDSAEPPDFAGNSHYLEHLLLFRGTEKYPKNEIGEWAAGRGGYFNGYTWYDYTAFVLMTAIDDLDGILDRHEQMMFHGSFSGQDFETEKKAVFEELRSGLDAPYRYVGRASPYHMYPADTFYSRSTIGTIETVQAATVQRVRQYYRDYYVPNNMTLVVVGAFDTDDLLQRITQQFGSYPAGNVPASIYEPVAMKRGVNVVAEERDVGKAYFLLASEGPRAVSPEWFPYLLLTEYLGGGKTSLLYSKLVTELELLDEINVQAWPRRYPKGWQSMSGESDPGKIVTAVAALWQEIENVRKAGVPNQQLDFARQRLLKKHWQALDDVNETAESLAIADAHGDYGLFADFEERLNAVSAVDVQAVTRKYLTPSNFFLMSVFPTGQIPGGFASDIQTNANQLDQAQGTVASIRLASGIELLHERKADAPLESYTAAIRAGQSHGATAGVAEAVAKMLIRETGQYSRNELQDFLDQNGFTLSASTTADATFVSLQAPADNAGLAMELLTEVLTNPAFSEVEWNSTRAEMLATLHRSSDEPNAVAADLLKRTVYAGTAYGRSDEDELEALTKISVNDLRKFWERYYKTESIAVAYTGATPGDQVQSGLASLTDLEGKAPPGASIDIAPIDAMVHAAQEMPGKTQDILYLTWHAPDLNSDDWIYWQLAEKALGGDLAGRLWKLRQDEGLAYSVWMFGSANKEQPLTMAYMATAGEKREAALAAIRREVRSAQSGLSQEELNRVKVSYLANLNRLDRTVARRSQRHAEWWVGGFAEDRREKLASVISAATLDEVNRVIREVLDSDNYVFVEAGAVAPLTSRE